MEAGAGDGEDEDVKADSVEEIAEESDGFDADRQPDSSSAVAEEVEE